MNNNTLPPPVESDAEVVAAVAAVLAATLDAAEDQRLAEARIGTRQFVIWELVDVGKKLTPQLTADLSEEQRERVRTSLEQLQLSLSTVPR